MQSSAFTIRVTMRGSTSHRCAIYFAAALAVSKAQGILLLNATLSAACDAGPLEIVSSLFVGFSGVVIRSRAARSGLVRSMGGEQQS